MTTFVLPFKSTNIPVEVSKYRVLKSFFVLVFFFSCLHTNLKLWISHVGLGPSNYLLGNNHVHSVTSSFKAFIPHIFLNI